MVFLKFSADLGWRS